MSLDVSGISRSGRVRKKSAKVKEMEESEKPDGAARQRNNSQSSGAHRSPVTHGTCEPDSVPRKSKKLKIKFSQDDGGVEELPIDNEIEQIDLNYVEKAELTVPSLKIKLFQNSDDNYVAIPKKEKKLATPKKAYKDNENSANYLFQQITSGHVADHSNKQVPASKKKSFSDHAANMLYNPDQTSDEDEEASLVISDSNKSLQAALEYAKSVKNPNRRLTETKIETTKSGVVKVKKVDSKADKKQKLSKITAYTLFARENRSRIQQSYPTLDFANISRRLGEVWQALPPREKMQWKRKALKQKGFNAVQQVNNNLTNQATKAAHQAQSKFVRHSISNSINNRYRNQYQQEIKVNLRSKTELFDDKQIKSYVNDPTSKQPAVNIIDLASHLKILGDSLNAIGSKLTNDECLNETDALDLLLDSVVCAMCPLICLTNLTPELAGCTESTQRHLLENVAFLMPGI